MALIPFKTILEHLQSPHSLPGGILSRQGGLHYGDIHYMPMHCILLMQCIPYHYISSQIYEPKVIPQFIQYIEVDLKQTKQKREASGSALRAQSYCMFVMDFGGIMVLPTDPPYCLVYPKIYSSIIAEKDRHHLNIRGQPSWGVDQQVHVQCPASVRQPVHGPQVAMPQESPSDSPGSTV